MAKRLIQLAKELKLRMSDLVDILDSLGYNNMSYSPNDIVPNHIAEMIAGICSDGDLLSLINHQQLLLILLSKMINII